jgi:hypothetical protein
MSFLGNIKKLITHYAMLPSQITQVKTLLIDNFVNDNLHNNPKYKDSKRLNTFEFKVFSQNGEDGIVEEIFNRIGTTNKFFVEFGVQDGIETNSTYLLLKEWKGLFIEGSPKYCTQVEQNFKHVITTGQLKIVNAFITVENIESLFDKSDVPIELDMLSIDIDGNDYYIWEAINKYKPRVLIAEYNAVIRPNIPWIVKYKADAVWNGTMHFNASLKSWELLSAKKGYTLVGCNFSGSNAFFVREDLIGDKFESPYTAENHFEPARFHLQKRDGHRRSFGEFIQK